MLGDKLNRLTGQIKGKKSNESSGGSRRLLQAAEYLGGETVKSPGGNFIKIVTDFTHNYGHGEYGLGELYGYYPTFKGTSILGPDAEEFDLTRLLFFDMETTGLSAAPGRWRFLSDSGLSVRKGSRCGSICFRITLMRRQCWKRCGVRLRKIRYW